MSIYCIHFLVSKLFHTHSFMNSLVYCVWALKWKIEWNVPDLLRNSLHLVYVSFGDYISKRNEWHSFSTTSAHFCPLIYLFLSDWDVIVCLVESSVFCSAAVYVYIFLSQRVPDIGPINSCHASFSPELWLIKILRWSSVAPFLSHVTSCIF